MRYHFQLCTEVFAVEFIQIGNVVRRYDLLRMLVKLLPVILPLKVEPKTVNLYTRREPVQYLGHNAGPAYRPVRNRMLFGCRCANRQGNNFKYCS